MDKIKLPVPCIITYLVIRCQKIELSTLSMEFSTRYVVKMQTAV